MPGLLHSIFKQPLLLTLEILKAKGHKDLATLSNREGKKIPQDKNQHRLQYFQILFCHETKIIFNISVNYSSTLGRAIGWENRGVLLALGKEM